MTDFEARFPPKEAYEAREKIKGVIFDMDGTLLDSRHAFEKQIEDFFRINGLAQKPSPAMVSRLLGKSYLEIFKTVLQNDDEVQQKEWLDWMNYSYRYFYMDRYARLFPGTKECVEALLKKGLRIGIATNAPRPVLDYFLLRYGFAELGLPSVSGDDVTNKKPNPEMILKLSKLLECEPQEIIYVGDMDIDVHAARAASCLSVAVLSGLSDEETIRASRPDAIIPSADWICRLLR